MENQLNNLLRFCPKQKILIWDGETENLRLCVNNKIWQLGFIICDGYNILEQHSYYLKYKDGLHISEDARRITRFNEQEYNKLAIPNEEVLSIFDKYLYNPEYINLGHNLISFDIYCHNLLRKYNNLPSNFEYLSRTIDTNSLAKMIKLGIKSLKRENWETEMYRFSNYYKKGVKTSLPAMGKELGIGSDLVDYENLHNATEDIKLNFHVWQKMKLMIDI